jgi:hypothetical protein
MSPLRTALGRPPRLRLANDAGTAQQTWSQNFSAWSSILMKGAKLAMIRIENDYSKTSCFNACQRKYFLSYVLKRVVDSTPAAPGFGSLVHLFMSSWYKDGDFLKAIQVVNKWEDREGDEKRTQVRMAEILTNYTRQYPSEPWKIIANEVPIELRIPVPEDFKQFIDRKYVQVDYQPPGSFIELPAITETPEFYLIGKVDLVIEWNGWLYGVDHKTTSSLGSSYFNRFKPDLQMFGYTWALRELFGSRVQGMLVNAISTAKTAGQVGSKAQAFARQLVTRTQKELDLYPETMISLLWKVHQAEATWEDAASGQPDKLAYFLGSGVARSLANFHFPPNFDSCTDYGSCQYRELCLSNLAPDLLSKLQPNTWDPRTQLEEV